MDMGCQCRPNLATPHVFPSRYSFPYSVHLLRWHDHIQQTLFWTPASPWPDFLHPGWKWPPHKSHDKSVFPQEGLAIRVQRIWLFYRKWNIQTLWWMQNWNLRHIYKIRFLIFWAVFCAAGLKFWKKCYYDLKIIFFEKNQERYQKTQKFTLISNPLKKFQKNEHEKSYKPNRFHEHK